MDRARGLRFRDGSPYTYQHLAKYALRPALERAGIKYEKSKTGFHLLRRSLATHIMKRTGNLMQAQVLLRHDDPTTTAAAYLCPDESIVHDNTAVIESAFTEPVSDVVQ